MTLSATPRASVVIPLYQKGAYIKRALESVFRQTEKSLEVIVVDDGSSDEGPRILQEIREPRLVVHTQANEGVSSARNRGISMARAPWVGFLDADDEWLPGFLESTLRITEASPTVVAAFSNFRDCQRRKPALRRVECQGFVVRDYFATLLENGGLGVSASSVLASRAQLLACGEFALGVHRGQDIDMWARLAWSGDLAYHDEPLAIYHTKIVDSVSKKAAEVIAPYPALLGSYSAWCAAGRIPARLRRSSLRYASWLLAQHVMELAHQGFALEGRRRLESGPRSPFHVVAWKARAWTWLPRSVLAAGRKLRRALSSRYYRQRSRNGGTGGDSEITS